MRSSGWPSRVQEERFPWFACFRNVRFCTITLAADMFGSSNDGVGSYERAGIPSGMKCGASCIPFVGDTRIVASMVGFAGCIRASNSNTRWIRLHACLPTA